MVSSRLQSTKSFQPLLKPCEWCSQPPCQTRKCLACFIINSEFFPLTHIKLMKGILIWYARQFSERHDIGMKHHHFPCCHILFIWLISTMIEFCAVASLGLVERQCCCCQDTWNLIQSSVWVSSEQMGMKPLAMKSALAKMELALALLMKLISCKKDLPHYVSFQCSFPSVFDNYQTSGGSL